MVVTRNGDILALASMPGFDPNDFSPSIPPSIWRRLMKDEARPLFNRATGGEYAPGSTFKLVTLLAALDSGKVRTDTRYACPGYFDLGAARFRCWQHWGHGSLAMPAAIQYSCNVYLYHAALACGANAVQAEARACGFGRKTGLASTLSGRALCRMMPGNGPPEMTSGATATHAIYPLARGRCL